MIKLKQYRDIWLSEKMNEIIGFYPREFYPLDNFSSFKVEWNGYLYSSLEEAYQAASFMGSDEELVEKIKHSHSADEAQRIAYANRDKQRSDWNEVKLEIMEELLRLKIEQNPYVKQKLLQTEDYLIVEDSPKDSFWGWGPNRDGENNLGKLWMKLREEIKKKETIVTHKMKLQNDPLNKIKSGKKTIELRLTDEKRQLLKIKDLIEFTNIETLEKIITEIEDLYKFSSFEELYEKLDKKLLGYNENEIADPKDMEKYYSKEKQKKYGVLGIKIKKI